MAFLRTFIVDLLSESYNALILALFLIASIQQ